MTGMGHGSFVAAGCLALLSLLRLQEGEPAAAGLLVLAAVALLGWGLRGLGSREQAAPTSPEDADQEAARHRGWQRIALLGLAVTAVGALTFPPMGLVVGALTLYAASRMRRSGRLAATPVVR